MNWRQFFTSRDVKFLAIFGKTSRHGGFELQAKNEKSRRRRFRLPANKLSGNRSTPRPVMVKLVKLVRESKTPACNPTGSST
jgi:hypothetical protein